jgi:hypothetical protein
MVLRAHVLRLLHGRGFLFCLGSVAYWYLFLPGIRYQVTRPVVRICKQPCTQRHRAPLAVCNINTCAAAQPRELASAFSQP